MQNTFKYNDEALIITLLEIPVVTVIAMIQWVQDHVEDVGVSLIEQKLYIVADNITLKELVVAFNRRFEMLSERYTMNLN